jgi:hypothetical protein
MAGTINLSLTQQLDEFGQPLSGGQLYVIQAGTVATPQNAYQDTALSILLPNPIPLDAAGRIPQFFLADGQIKVRLQDSSGVVKFVADNLLVIGPSAGGGSGGASIDPTTVMQTGDLKIRYDNAIIPGFVRCNARTIGNAASGATELADPTAQALFNHLWLKDATLAVTPGGRGASGAADWAANKQIALPDGRARHLTALADMGNTDVGLFAGVAFSKGNSTTLGSILGAARHTLSLNEIPSGITSSGSNSISVSATFPGNVPYTSGVVTFFNFGSNVGATCAGVANNTWTGFSSQSSSGNNSIAVTSNNTNGLAYDIANPSLLVTIYLKL